MKEHTLETIINTATTLFNESDGSVSLEITQSKNKNIKITVTKNPYDKNMQIEPHQLDKARAQLANKLRFG